MNDWQAPTIKIAVVIAALSRWTGALMAAEGFDILEAWAWWWIPVSAIMAAAMAIVEGWALSYVFNAWKKDKDNQLLIAALLSSIIFIIVLAPYIAAQVRDVTLSTILVSDWTLGAWSIAVAASTISIVISVGLAEKRAEENWFTEQQEGFNEVPEGYIYQVEDKILSTPIPPQSLPTGDVAPLLQPELDTPETNGNGGYCWCGKWCENSHVYPAHIRHDHIAETLYDPVSGDRYGSSATARDAMLERYKDTIPGADLPFPSLEKVNEMRRSKTAQKIQERIRSTE